MMFQRMSMHAAMANRTNRSRLFQEGCTPLVCTEGEMLLDVEVPSLGRAGTTALVMSATMELSGPGACQVALDELKCLRLGQFLPRAAIDMLLQLSSSNCTALTCLAHCARASTCSCLTTQSLILPSGCPKQLQLRRRHTASTHPYRRQEYYQTLSGTLVLVRDPGISDMNAV
jgi:hypothetical protein